ncbi:MAG: MBL fold metallo-hydrolase [Halobacteriota archaeon]
MNNDVEVETIELWMEWPPQEVSVHLIEAEDTALVDAGVGTEDGKTEVLDALASRDVSREDVDHVLVTHPHVDHVGAATEFPEATVYAHEDVADYLVLDDSVRDEMQVMMREAGLKGSYLDGAYEESVAALEANIDCLPPDSVDVPLSDGDSVDVGGFELKAIHTPGHQRYHHCYRSEGEHPVFFAGDAVARSFRSVTYGVGFREGMYDAVANYYDAFETLSEQDVEVVYPGHGPVFDDLPSAVERGVDSLDRLVEGVREAVDDLGEATAVDVALHRAEEPEDVRHLLFDNIGALGYLEREGDVESEVVEGSRRFSPAE